MPKHIGALSIQSEDRPLTKDQPIEIIERKGKGHPDSLCDALVETASIAINQVYLKHTERILHYNLDKGLLAAGKAEPAFGGGKVLIPIKMIMGDRATFQYLNKSLPVWDTLVKAAQNYISHNFRYLDPKKNLTFPLKVMPECCITVSEAIYSMLPSRISIFNRISVQLSYNSGKLLGIEILVSS